ncbi:hypothetical protein M9H77_21015 [Catharanthus roseus]|uniref:Uncharacterized protein n=1 Tax=Catharanthus roseus TaxID=4058 RepID=A0ACC0AL46_CATRO|nr:hypothetical protein M9H77_21015 [Catharanthus roseus]
MAIALWTTITEAIDHYTGLSPTAFFTIMALMVVTYRVVCGMFVAAEDYVAVKKANEFVVREPVQLGEVTEEELREYDGKDPNKPLLMAIKGQIYDVSRSRCHFLIDWTQEMRLKFSISLTPSQTVCDSLVFTSKLQHVGLSSLGGLSASSTFSYFLKSR